MLGLSTFKLSAIAVGVAFVLGAAGGWKTRDAFCDAAAAKARVASLETQIKARDAASTQDAARIRVAEEAKAKLEGVARELESRISAGECFGANDADRVRDLWR
jgi:hypothetical protein